MSKPLLVYVAGPLSNGGKATPIQYLNNVHAMNETGDRIERHGEKSGRTYYAYRPCNDMLEAIQHGEKKVEELQAKSIEVLKRCDCVYRMMGDSPGTDTEVVVAKDYGIPVVETLGQLDEVKA